MLTRSKRLMFNTEPVQGGGEQNSAAFPANTPVKDMTPEQQIAFHENKARKLEDKLKGFNGLTPDQVTALQAELADEKAKGKTAEEQALDSAREAGRAEVRSATATQVVDTALSIALRGRVADASALFGLDKSSFVKDGQADVDAITTWVDENSQSKDETTAKPFPNLFQGERERVNKTDRETGKAEAHKRFGTNS